MVMVFSSTAARQCSSSLRAKQNLQFFKFLQNANFCNYSTTATATATADATVVQQSSTNKSTNFANGEVLQNLTKHKRVSLEDIEEAQERVRTMLRPTPLIKSPRLAQDLLRGEQASNWCVGGQLYFKMENKHFTGSFKERGAINKLQLLTQEERAAGVVAASAGNHAQAVAYHAKRLSIDAKIVMPESTPLTKVQGTEQWGASVVLHGESLDDSYAEALRIMDGEKRTLIHPFNDKDIIAGQGTLGLELMEQNPYLDAVVIPIGGGGMIAGTAVALKSVNPRIRVYGVEASNMPGMKHSLASGQVTKVPFVSTLADGIAVKTVGPLTFDLIKDYVDDIVTVTEDEIAGAVLDLLEKEKTMAEGAGAAGYAALLYGKLKLSANEKRVCCVLSGGNIDVSVMRAIIDRGLVKSGRMARMRIMVPDSPGNLARCLTILAQQKVNVKEIVHERAFKSIPVGFTAISVTLMTKGHDHLAEVKAVLAEHKYIFSFEE